MISVAVTSLMFLTVTISINNGRVIVLVFVDIRSCVGIL